MDFRATVIQLLEDALGEDAAALGDLGTLLTRPPKVELGDLAFPCFPLAKVRRKAPPQIAQELAAAMAPTGPVGRIAATGPFLNFFADPTAQLDALARGLADGSFLAQLRTAAPQRVMIEFSQPNTHKVFHVGHLRNVVLGDALVRVFRARGHDVVAANYYGDFGIDVAKTLWWLRTHPEETAPETGRLGWLGAAYQQATRALKEAEARGDDSVRHAVREVLRAMEQGEPEVTALYRETRQWCLDEFAEIYEAMGVHFDVAFYESELEEPAARIVDDYLAKGVLEESRGAIICDLEEEGLGAALVRKSDGSSLYMTWDLALAREKFERFDIERSLYVVATEQRHHFRQLFAMLLRMGYERAQDCRHIAYELVMLPSGKMSSRAGTVVPLADLRESVRASVREKMAAEERAERAGWSEANWEAVITAIVQSSLKYGMLRVTNNRTVTFDADEWTSPEGDTGAYLLYGLARMASIFRKGGADAEVDLSAGVPSTEGYGAEAERELLNHLLTYPQVVARVEETCEPSALAHFLYEAVKIFSRFYNQCPVLKAEPALRHARLVLVKATERVLRHGFELLGLHPVEAM